MMNFLISTGKFHLKDMMNYRDYELIAHYMEHLNYALKNKYITITPIHSDLTDDDFLAKLDTYDF